MAKGKKNQKKSAQQMDHEASVRTMEQAMDYFPILTIAPKNNSQKWMKAAEQHIAIRYGINGTWWRTGVYPAFNTLVLGEDYGLEDIDPENDPGGINLARIKKENDLALAKRDKLTSDRLSMYAAMWTRI
eukprot:gene18256-23307_t